MFTSFSICLTFTGPKLICFCTYNRDYNTKECLSKLYLYNTKGNANLSVNGFLKSMWINNQVDENSS